MNLYIALLSETFARVYQNAKANAALLQATTILQVEKALSKKRKNLADEFIQKECSPMVRIFEGVFSHGTVESRDPKRGLQDVAERAERNTKKR